MVPWWCWLPLAWRSSIFSLLPSLTALFKAWPESHLLFKAFLVIAFCTYPLSLATNSSLFVDAFWHLEFMMHFQGLYISPVGNDLIFWTLGKVSRRIAVLANREKFIRKGGRMRAWGVCPMLLSYCALDRDKFIRKRGRMRAWGVNPMTSEILCIGGRGARDTSEPWDLERLFSKIPHPETLRQKSEHQSRIGNFGRSGLALEPLIILMRGKEVLKKIKHTHTKAA